MAYNNDFNTNVGTHEHRPASPLQLDLQLTDQEVDDALNFGLDFDVMAETIGEALPNVGLDDLRSLGTRSPSPSESASVNTKGSKRSRAEFDSESECDSQRDAQAKRMISHNGFTIGRSVSGLSIENQLEQQPVEKMAAKPRDSSDNKLLIKQDREREGRCPDCGLDTFRVVMTENGFELQPLTIPGEVLNGRCLICQPLKEDDIIDKDPPSSSSTGVAKKGDRKSSDANVSKKKGGSRSGRNHESDLALFQDSKGRESEQTAHPPPSRKASSNMNNMGSNMSVGSNRSNTLGSPSFHQQQRQMMRNMVNSPSSGGIPFPPPDRRDSRRPGGNKFTTPTPSQYHSKMALTKQAQLPRKCSAMQHARMAFGNNMSPNQHGGNKKGRNQSAALVRKSSGAGGNNPRGNWTQQADRQPLSSTGSVSSVSCSEIDGATHTSRDNHHPNDGDDNFSKPTNLNQYNFGGVGMMSMGMQCTETMTAETNNEPQDQRSLSRPRSQSPHPQTPLTQRRAPSGRARSRSGAQIPSPQSVPVNMMNTVSGRVALTHQSVPNNLNNNMSARMGSGGQSQQSYLSAPKVGNVPQAARVAHSKLQSSIYHHHIFPMNDETERAHAEKTLGYLESGSGDICDIIVAMRRFPFSVAIQRVACEKLYSHCFDLEHANAIGLVGGIRTVIDAMEHHPDNVSLQRMCVGVIKQLAIAGTYNLEMLDRMDAVDIVVSTMERHPRSASLLESCCWALESMSRNPSSDIKKRVVKSGGIHAAMKAVDVFPNNESLLRAAFHCLRQLGCNPAKYNQQSNQQQQQTQHQQQHHQRHSSNSHQQHSQQQNNNQQQQQQQVPPFVSHRGGGGVSMARSGGMLMSNMSNHSMMGSNNNMMGTTNGAMMGNKNSSSNRRM